MPTTALNVTPESPVARTWRGRSLFPTDMTTAELRGFSRGLRMRSVFSARVTNAHFLAEVQEVVERMLKAEIAMGEGRYRLLRKLKALGYTPEGGFPEDQGAVPPAEPDSLQDLTSERRLNLLLETNVRVAQNAARQVAGNAGYARWAYPAWELVRILSRAVPRGSAESHSVGWPKRWREAGEEVAWEGAVQERMVALKDSPIWAALGDGAGGHADVLDNPFPPFAFNSGMGWREVERDEVLGLGLLGGEKLQPAKQPVPDLTPGEKEAARVLQQMPENLRAQLERELEALGV